VTPPPPPPPPLTLTAYAARRGCSVKSVSIAVRDRRLVASVGRNDRDQPVILDSELADREWTANTRRRADYTPPDAVEVGHPPTDAVASRVTGAEVRAEDGRTQHSTTPIGHSDVTPPYNVSRDLRAAAAARREAAAADLAELELAAKRGKLVDADQARADVVNRYSLVKTRLLAVPTALGQRLPDLAARVVPVVDELLREALKELSADGRGNGA
jgi:phage terminase Nu1 subunit (DNA packaging protein)